MSLWTYMSIRVSDGYADGFGQAVWGGWVDRNVQRFQGGLAFKVQRLVYHSTLGLKVIKKVGWQTTSRNLRSEPHMIPRTTSRSAIGCIRISVILLVILFIDVDDFFYMVMLFIYWCWLFNSLWLYYFVDYPFILYGCIILLIIYSLWLYYYGVDCSFFMVICCINSTPAPWGRLSKVNFPQGLGDVNSQHRSHNGFNAS